MKLDQIIETLETAPAGGRTEGELARLGFLEWVWSLPGDADFADEATRADARVRARGASSGASRAFLECLSEAKVPLPSPERRGGRQGRPGLAH